MHQRGGEVGELIARTINSYTRSTPPAHRHSTHLLHRCILTRTTTVTEGPRDALLLPHARFYFFALSVISFFWLCLKYLGNGWTDLRQIHRKTCLVPRLDNFECQGQRSRSPGTKKRKKLLSHAVPDWTNISGIAERICAKFTGKTSLVARSDEFQGQGQRSKFKVARQKNAFFTPITPPAPEWNALAANDVTQWQTVYVAAGWGGADFGGLVCGVCLVKCL